MDFVVGFSYLWGGGVGGIYIYLADEINSE